MSALYDDMGAMLNTIVEVQRGMSPSEIDTFLITGVMPDLSKSPPENADPNNLTAISETDARQWLGMITASTVDNLD